MNLSLARVLSAPLMLATCTGCLLREETGLSSDVNQARIHQAYSIRYDGSSRKTQVTAVFRFESALGTTLRLSGQSSVTHNMRSMYGSEDSLFGGYSYCDSDSGAVTQHQFQYVNGEGKTFANSATLLTASLTNPPSTLSLGMNLAPIYYTGGAPATGETVELVISDAPGSGTYKSVRFGYSLLDPLRFDVLASGLSQIGLGAKTMRISRYRSVPLQQGTEVGGSIVVRYDGPAVPVQVIP